MSCLNSNLALRTCCDRNRHTPRVALATEKCRLDFVQGLERNESARRVSSVGKKYLIEALPRTTTLAVCTGMV